MTRAVAAARLNVQECSRLPIELRCLKVFSQGSRALSRQQQQQQQQQQQPSARADDEKRLPHGVLLLLLAGDPTNRNKNAFSLLVPDCSPHSTTAKCFQKLLESCNKERVTTRAGSVVVWVPQLSFATILSLLFVAYALKVKTGGKQTCARGRANDNARPRELCVVVRAFGDADRVTGHCSYATVTYNGPCSR